MIFLEVDTGGGYVSVACLLEYSEAEDLETVGTTTRQNGGWRTALGLVQGLAINGSGLIPKDALLFSYEDLLTLKRNKTLFNVRIDTDEYEVYLTELTLDANGATDLGFTFKMVATGNPDGPPIPPDPPPSGYSVLFVTDPVDENNETAVMIRINGGTTGDTYNYTITSSGGGTPIVGSGTVTGNPTNFMEDVSTLGDGTLTVELTLTNANGTGSPVQDTVLKDTTPPPPAPSGYSVVFDEDPVLAAATSFTVQNVTVGWNYSFAITSSGGGSPVTGNGTISTSPNETIPVNVGTLPNGTLTINLTMTNAGGAGPTVSDTTTKSI